MHKESNTAEMHEMFKTKLFKNQTIPETKLILSRMFLDIMCSDNAEDTVYRNDVVATVEVFSAFLSWVETNEHPEGIFQMTVTHG